MKALLVMSDTLLLLPLEGFSDITRAHDLAMADLRRFDAALIVGSDALTRGVLAAACQGGLSTAALLMEEPLLSDDTAAFALSESLFFAARVFAPPRVGETLLARFPHIAGKFVPLSDALTPDDLRGGPTNEAIARLYRPRMVLATPPDRIETLLYAEDDPRPPLPVRVWRVLRRRGLGHIVRHVWQTVQRCGQRPRR